MEKEKILSDATLCYLIKGDEVLLPLKTMKIGKGCRNGYGGGIENREKQKMSAIRELKEESGGVIADSSDLQKVALIDFHNTTADGKKFICKVHVYLIKNWREEPIATDEMADPKWFSINSLPDNLMSADKEWLPLVLKGEKITAMAEYGPHQKKLLAPVEITRVESFSE